MYNELNIDLKISKFVDDCEKKLEKQFKTVDEICEYNSLKVLSSFHKHNVSELHFNQTTGYGYDDIGRDIIEKIFADCLGAEDALVRNQFISGSHALTVALFSCLRPNDLLLSITGTPYDTLHEVIGIKKNSSSLMSYNIKYNEIDLINDDFNYEEIKKCLLNNNVKVVYIQRSKGYSTRKSISIEKIEEIAGFVKSINENIIIMVDNCYCEFTTKKEPCMVGCDICVGSLIKNLGGGIAPNGAYIAGKRKYIKLAAERLTIPGEGKEVGPSLGINKYLLQGIYLAPETVKAALKTAILTSYVMEKLKYKVEPRFNEKRVDIVQNIIFNNEKDLVNYCIGIQKASAINSNYEPTSSNIPGYDDKIIMASGSFTQGSSIEISCDGPIKKPYIAYQQGAMTYSYGKLALKRAISEIKKVDKNI